MQTKVWATSLALILSCLVGLSSSSRDELYQALNRRLRMIHNPHKDVRMYLDGANRELEECRINPESYLEGYTECLEEFTKLRLLLDDIECSYADYEIMEPVTRKVTRHRYSSRPGNMSPVNWVVYSIGLARAEKCRTEWPKKFNAIYGGAMSRNVIRYAEFSNWDWLGGDNDVDRMQRLIKYRYKQLDLDIIHEAIEHIEKHSRYHQDGCNFKQMTIDYLIEPCSRYRNTIGKLVLTQAVYDAEMFDGFNGYVINDSMMEFYLAMAHNEQCQATEDERFGEIVYETWWGTQIAKKTPCFFKIIQETGPDTSGSIEFLNVDSD